MSTVKIWSLIQCAMKGQDLGTEKVFRENQLARVKSHTLLIACSAKEIDFSKMFQSIQLSIFMQFQVKNQDIKEDLRDNLQN